MNANNNTYTCLRTINATHNFLYCEFVTGLVTFYNLRIGEILTLAQRIRYFRPLKRNLDFSDPFQQLNRFHSLNGNEKSWLRGTLSELMKCRGAQECNFRGGFRQTMNIDSQHLPKRLTIPGSILLTNQIKDRRVPEGLQCPWQILQIADVVCRA